VHTPRQRVVDQVSEGWTGLGWGLDYWNRIATAVGFNVYFVCHLRAAHTRPSHPDLSLGHPGGYLYMVAGKVGLRLNDVVF